MKYVRVYSDDRGQSHFAELDMRLVPAVLSLSMPALEACEPLAASQLQFLHLPPGWSTDWQPAPAYQYLCILAGEAELSVGDGDTRRFSGGDVLHLQDIGGKGHVTRVVGEAGALLAVVRQA